MKFAVLFAIESLARATISGPILHFERDKAGKVLIRNTEVFYGLTATNVDAPAIDAYRQFQSAHLTRANGVQTVKTDIPMQTVKQSIELPV